MWIQDLARGRCMSTARAVVLVFLRSTVASHGPQPGTVRAGAQTILLV